MLKPLIKTLNSRFSHLIGEDVVIYGMGQLAFELLESRRELVFNVVGVMDRDITEGTFKGVPIVNMDNVCTVAKVIIIAALGSSCPIIYDRISFLKDCGVDIYFPDGEKRSARTETRASEYFISNRKRLAELIDAHDVISFDVFDTLVMRKCLFPREIFNILEQRRVEPGFAVRRLGAEQAAVSALGRLPTIFEIYTHMGLDITDAEAEIELEREMLTTRGDMKFFFDYALKRGKNVALTSDMYLPEPVMNKLLAGDGIKGFDKIFVSCDFDASKRNGSIWAVICKDYPNAKILHIGDNAVSDGISQCGVTPFLIKGTIEVADLLGFGKALASARDFNDYTSIGTALARLLSLEITNVDSVGRIIINNMEDIGYCFIAPQTHGFVTWIARTAGTNGETELLFCARDAYMFMRLYEKIRERYNAPPAKYLYISKRVLCGVLADSLENIKECLEYYYARFEPKMTVKEAIYRLFGVDLPTDGIASRSVKEVSLAALLDEIDKSYISLFHENAKKEYGNFVKYLEKEEINPHKLAIVDYLCGKSVRLAEKLFDVNFYLYGATDPGLPVNVQNGKIYTWLESPDDLYIPLYNIMKNTQFGEAVYSSPEGTCLAFDEYGEPVLDDEQIDFSANEGIYRGVESFYSDASYPVNSKTADDIFGALFIGNYSITDAIKSMTWSSYTAGKGEQSV